MSLSQLSLLYGSLREIERRSTCAFPEVPAWPFTGRELTLFFWGGILLLYALRVQGKLAGLERQFQGPQLMEACVDISPTQREDVCILTKFHR